MWDKGLQVDRRASLCYGTTTDKQQQLITKVKVNLKGTNVNRDVKALYFGTTSQTGQAKKHRDVQEGQE
jgi:hypothetical protein